MEKKKKRGRPVLSDAERRREVLQIRLSVAEKAYLEKKAKHANKTLAQYIREKTGVAGGADVWNNGE